jgi:hypothetical protein
LISVGKKETELASALARARWSDVSPEDRADHARTMANARWDKTTPEARSAAARAAVKARWDAVRAAKQKRKP